MAIHSIDNECRGVSVVSSVSIVMVCRCRDVKWFVVSLLAIMCFHDIFMMIMVVDVVMGWDGLP
jgi:hypothetical protein